METIILFLEFNTETHFDTFMLLKEFYDSINDY